MEWLSENPLALMPGPEFLVFYGLLCIAVLAIYLFWIGEDDGAIPAVPARPDPYELAYLREGAAGVGWLAIFALKRAGRANMDDRGIVTPLDGPPPSDRYAAAALADIGKGGKADDIAGSSSGALGAAVRKLDATLAARGLARKAEDIRRVRARTYVVGAALVALALYKLAAATSHGRHNVGFLLLEALAALVALALIGRSRGRRGATARGGAFLKRVKLAHGERNGGATAAPLLLVGLFGYTVLAGGPDAAFAKAAQKSQSSGGSSCSSSCSSGDGGGGGCGGCGGGD
jgi:uncharacterized protein (TIGR04222 family)